MMKGFFLSAFICFFGSVSAYAVVEGSLCDCLEDPTNSCCSSYVYPNSSADITKMCMMMTMFSCSINDLCLATTLQGDKCNSFSVLGDLCVDMPGMSGCKNYNKLCKTENTNVNQCSTYAPIDGVLKSSQASTSVKNLCGSMPGMDGCSDCITSNGTSCNCKDMSSNVCFPKNTSSTLQILSKLCLSMPSMSDCDPFINMCNQIESGFEAVCGTYHRIHHHDAPFCRGDGTTMYMTGFKFTLTETDPCPVFLFEEWIIDSKLKVSFACIGVFLIGALLPLLGNIKKYYTNQYKNRAVVLGVLNFLLISVQFTLGYFLMLLAMSMYGCLFLAVVFGLSAGYVIFPKAEEAKAEESCHRLLSSK